jgi:sterol desaturase/sphingolipid hydroxylase (fatty acid hydroxylase superfamily)
MNAMALPLLAMVGCILAEMLLTRTRRGLPIPWRDLVLNLDSGHILMWLLRGVEIAVYAWVAEHASLQWASGWPPFALWIFALFAWDLGFYWMHRLHHMLPVLWSVHVVHHEGEHFNLSLGVRNAWLSSLTTLPFTSLPLALAGVPLPVFVAVSTFHYTVQFYNHNSFVKRSGWLEKIFITPAHHRVHHGRNREYRDRNFGGTFLLWDQLFGSFQSELPGVPVQYGVHQPTPSSNPFWANVAPLLRYAGLKTPKAADTPRPAAVPDLLIGTGGLLLFVAVAYYIHRDGTWPAGGQAVFFGLIFASTLALGGMSDGRRWGLPCWIALGTAACLLMPLAFELDDPLGLLSLAVLPAHGVLAALAVRKQAAMNRAHPDRRAE